MRDDTKEAIAEFTAKYTERGCAIYVSEQNMIGSITVTAARDDVEVGKILITALGYVKELIA